MPAPSVPGFDHRASDEFIVAERYAGTPWPTFGKQAVALKQMRRDYEAGLIEMAQRREGRMEYQYAIPRKTIGTQRPGYFHTPN